MQAPEVQATDRAAEAGSSQRAAALEIHASPDEPSTQQVSRAAHTALSSGTDATCCCQAMTSTVLSGPLSSFQPVLVGRRLLHEVSRTAAVPRPLQRSPVRSLMGSVPWRSAGQPLTTQPSHCVALCMKSALASCRQTVHRAACPHVQHTADTANACRGGRLGTIPEASGRSGTRSAVRSCNSSLSLPLSVRSIPSASLAAHQQPKPSMQL